MLLNEVFGFDSIRNKIATWLQDRRNAKIQRVWDEKSDDDILVAFSNYHDWMSIENRRPGMLPETLVSSLEDRFQRFILPQLKKRDLDTW